MQGGLPIGVDGEMIGTVGASFDTLEHDVQIARAGLTAIRLVKFNFLMNFLEYALMGQLLHQPL
jgi:hypothetical protein